MPVTDPPGTLFISGAEGIEITVKAAEGTVIGVPYYWQSGLWQPLLGDATVAPRQVKAVAGGVDIGHLYFNKPATPLWFAVLETGGGTVGFCDIREAEGSTVLGQQDISGSSGGGGGGGTVDQGNSNSSAAEGWSVRLSNGSAFYNALTDTQLRASAVPVSAAALTDGTQRANVTDGTNNAAVLNAAAAGTEYGLAVRPVFTLPTVAPRTYTTLAALTFTQIATANTALKGRIIYNNGGNTVYIGLGSTAISPAAPRATSSFPLASGQYYEFYPTAGGVAQWLGDVYAMSEVGGSQITVTEIS